jgi:hypothetical protein
MEDMKRRIEKGDGRQERVDAIQVGPMLLIRKLTLKKSSIKS